MNRHTATGLLALAVWAWLCAGVLASWLADLWNDPNYGHGLPLLVVLLAAGALRAWRARGAAGGRPLPLAWPWLVAIGGTLATALGWLGTEDFLLRCGSVLLALWWAFAMLPPAVAGSLLAPGLALLALVPWPYVVFYGLTARLQLLSSQLAAASLEATGVALVRDGNLLRLEGYQLAVVEACSGLRSLLSLLALAALLAALRRLRPGSTVLLLVAAVPLAVLVNALRLWGSGIAAQLGGPERADILVHGGGGLLVFAVGSLLLAAIAFRLPAGAR